MASKIRLRVSHKGRKPVAAPVKPQDDRDRVPPPKRRRR